MGLDHSINLAVKKLLSSWKNEFVYLFHITNKDSASCIKGIYQGELEICRINKGGISSF